MGPKSKLKVHVHIHNLKVILYSILSNIVHERTFHRLDFFHLMNISQAGFFHHDGPQNIANL